MVIVGDGVGFGVTVTEIAVELGVAVGTTVGDGEAVTTAVAVGIGVGATTTAVGTVVGVTARTGIELGSAVDAATSVAVGTLPRTMAVGCTVASVLAFDATVEAGPLLNQPDHVPWKVNAVATTSINAATTPATRNVRESKLRDRETAESAAGISGTAR